MKKIATVLVLLTICGLSQVARAQKPAGTGELSFRSGKLYVGEVPLIKETAADYLAGPLAEKYGKALMTEKVGAVMAYTGVGIAAVSGIAWGLGEAHLRQSGSDIVPAAVDYGMIGSFCGAVVGVGGLVTYLVGRNQVRLIGKRAAGDMTQAELDFGLTTSGVGLALNF